MIVDASSTDNDVLNLTATSDIANTPTIVGVENMNVSFSGFTAGGNTDLAIAMTNVGATKLNVTASGSTAVTAATIDGVATGTEITTGATFKTVNLTTVDDNAALVMNTSATSATATSTVNVTAAGTGALTALTVNETVGHVDINVTAGDLDGTLTVTGAKDVDVQADSAKTVVITSGEDVVITSLAKATSVEITAAKDVSDAGDDLLDAATTLSITAGGRVNGVDFDAAKTVTIAAAGVDTSATGGSDKSSTITGEALETLNVSGNGAALEINVDDMSDTLKTINVSGDQAVTVEMNAATIAATTELALNNAGTGAATLVLGNTTLADNIDLKKVATTTAIRMDVNEATADVIAVASGATVTFNAAQTDVAFTADSATASTNTLSLKVDKANATTSTYAIADLTTTNIKTVNLDLSVDTADTTLGTVNVGAANNLSVNLGANKLTAVTDVVAATLTLTGSGDVALPALTISELNASAMTGKVSYEIADGNVVRTGSADDTLTVAAGAAIDMYVESGAGNDSLTFAAQNYSTKTVNVNLGDGSLDAVTVANGANISGAAVSITGAEKFTFSGDATVNDTLLNGSSAAIFGGTDSDVTIVVTQNSNDFSSLAIDTASISAADGDSFIIDASARTAAQNIVGTDASDVITGSNTSGVFADTLNGGEGNDTIKVTEGGDAVTGGAGTDTIDFTVIDDAFTTIEGTASDATGMIVNLGTTAVSATTVAVNASGSYISKSLTEIGAGKFGYLFGTDATTNSTVLGTVASVENVTGSTGADYIIGSASANVILGGTGADVIIGGAGADNVNGEGGNDIYIFSAIGDLVTLGTTAAVTADTDADGTTAEELTNADSYDVLTWATGDVINLSGIDADTGTAGDQAFTFSTDNTAVAGTSDAIDTTGTSGQAILQTGTYDATNGDFTHTAGGVDGLLVLNDGTNVSYIVIVGGATLAGTDFVL